MKEQETVIKRTEQLDIDGMICELLQEQCTDGENVKFTNRAVDLIHKIRKVSGHSDCKRNARAS